MIKKLICAVLLTTLVAYAAQGASITWTLEDATFSDGGTLSGSFTFDIEPGSLADPFFGDLTALDITSTTGSLQAGYNYTINSFGDQFYNDETMPGPPTPTDSAGYAPDVEICDVGCGQILNILFATPLTAAGGTVAIVSPVDGQTADLSYEENGIARENRTIVGGFVTATGVDTPEPDTWSLILAPVGMITWKNRRSRLSRPNFQKRSNAR